MGHGLIKRDSNLTIGEPLDAAISVAILAKLERVCIELGIDTPESTILVADSHAIAAMNAKGGSFIGDIEGDAVARDIIRKALRKKDYLESLSRHFGAKRLGVALASNIHGSSEYKAIKDRIEPFVHENSYTLLELADIAWFNEILGVNIKLGWTNTSHEGGERAFDSQFRKQGLDDTGKPRVGFIYQVPGVDLWSGMLRPPYIAVAGEGRILLDLHSREDVRETVGKSSVAGLKHVQKLATSIAPLLEKEPPDAAGIGDWIFENIVQPVRSSVKGWLL